MNGPIAGAPGLLRAGQISTEGALQVPVLNARAQAIGGFRLGYAVSEIVALELGLHGSSGPIDSWVMTHLGARLTYAPGPNRKIRGAIDGEFGGSVGVAGPLLTAANGSYVGAGLGFHVHRVAPFVRARMQVSPRSGLMLWGSVLWGAQLAISQAVGIHVGGGFHAITTELRGGRSEARVAVAGFLDMGLSLRFVPARRSRRERARTPIHRFHTGGSTSGATNATTSGSSGGAIGKCTSSVLALSGSAQARDHLHLGKMPGTR